MTTPTLLSRDKSVQSCCDDAWNWLLSANYSVFSHIIITGIVNGWGHMIRNRIGLYSYHNPLRILHQLKENNEALAIDRTMNSVVYNHNSLLNFIQTNLLYVTSLSDRTIYELIQLVSLSYHNERDMIVHKSGSR